TLTDEVFVFHCPKFQPLAHPANFGCSASSGVAIHNTVGGQIRSFRQLPLNPTIRLVYSWPQTPPISRKLPPPSPARRFSPASTSFIPPSSHRLLLSFARFDY